ncbi:MAG: C25 family peptidase propeptide domain-containing protein, partial [Gaiellaceae bacterium]
MAHHLRGSAALLALSLLALASAPARGADVQLAASDANGVTLRLDLDQWDVGPAGTDGRSQVTARGLRMLDQPGRPQLPYANALIALPPGARVTVTLLSTTPETREGVRIRIGPRSQLFGNGLNSDYTSRVDSVPPVRDGPWPATDAATGEIFQLRGQRLVAVALHPFHYDERT